MPNFAFVQWLRKRFTSDIERRAGLRTPLALTPLEDRVNPAPE